MLALGSIGLAAAAAAAMTAAPARQSEDEPVRRDDEKHSRQRKRWLQKQARKAQHRRFKPQGYSN